MIECNVVDYAVFWVELLLRLQVESIMKNVERCDGQDNENKLAVLGRAIFIDKDSSHLIVLRKLLRCPNLCIFCTVNEVPQSDHSGCCHD